MPLDFRDLEMFVQHLNTLKPGIEKAQRGALQTVAKEIKKDARAQLGTYQGSAGPFPAWRQLAQVTMESRHKRGFPRNEPLLVEGNLKRSIKYKTTKNKALIGSASPYAAAQEKGVPAHNLPARPYLGPAAYRHSIRAAELVGRAVAEAIAGKVGKFSSESSDD